MNPLPSFSPMVTTTGRMFFPKLHVLKHNPNLMGLGVGLLVCKSPSLNGSSSHIK
jgi:hypothetical protein